MGAKFSATVSAVFLIIIILISGCLYRTGPEVNDVSLLLHMGRYDQPIIIKGVVSEKGELLCSCFKITSGGDSVTVWYDGMINDDGTSRPAVDVSSIENGDEVTITGMLRKAGAHTSENDFWLMNIIEVNRLIGGQTDAHGCLIAAGYSWCESKQKCLRIWEEGCEEMCLNMSLTEAKQIGLAGECSGNCTGGCFLETHVCNEYTNTWWIDLDIEMEGCNPACVVNTVTKEAEINWRCTGLL